MTCQMSVDDSTWRYSDVKPCRNRARFRVVTDGWTKLVCGVHVRPYRSRFEAGGPYAEWIRSVTELPA